MNELNIYQIFKDILEKSKVIGGRFHVSSADGFEINTNTVDEQQVVDILGSITPAGKKFPLSLLLPPVEVITPNSRGWSRFNMKMYFLTKQHSVDGSMKSLNIQTNTSGHPTHYDWKDMRECALDFLAAFEFVIAVNGANSKIRACDSESIYVERITRMGNDKANGVRVSFYVDLYLPCQEADYNREELRAITIRETPIHPLHKH